MNLLLNSFEIKALLLSTLVASVASLITLPIAFIGAYSLSKPKLPGKILLDTMIHLPLILPPVVIGYGLLLLLGRKGLIGHAIYEWFEFSFTQSWIGAAVASSVVALPLMVRQIRLGIEAVDRNVVDAAVMLGASRMVVIFKIILPLSRRAIISGWVLGFARSLSEFGATISFVAMIEGKTMTLPLAIYSLLQSPNNEGAATRLCLISILLAVITLLVGNALSRKPHI